MERIDLNGEWRLAFTDPRTGEAREIKAQVPGNAEVDLMAAEPGLDFWNCENWETADTFCMTRFICLSNSPSYAYSLAMNSIRLVAWETSVCAQAMSFSLMTGAFAFSEMARTRAHLETFSATRA